MVSSILLELYRNVACKARLNDMNPSERADFVRTLCMLVQQEGSGKVAFAVAAWILGEDLE